MIHDWAKRWNIPHAAMADLLQSLGAQLTAPPKPTKGKLDEAYIQSRVRLAAPAQGVTLWRNNVGVLPDARGVPVRYGLANESPGMNARVKSSDLIGWRPVTIGPGDIGRVIAQFVSYECKAPNWKFSGSDREMAQLTWIGLVAAAGGDAKFISDA